MSYLHRVLSSFGSFLLRSAREVDGANHEWLLEATFVVNEINIILFSDLLPAHLSLVGYPVVNQVPGT